MSSGAIPTVGAKPPTFQLPAWPEGKSVKLADFKGRKVVLFFYPGDLTPTCTTEACDFRDAHADFAKSETVVLGISPDGLKSHQKFAEKYELPYTLLVDEGHAVAEQYGLWVEKLMFGRKGWGVQRATFLIGRDGTIAAAWPKVRMRGHVAEVAAKAAELG